MTRQFLFLLNRYDYSIEEIIETREESMSIICEKKAISDSPINNRSRKNTGKRKLKENQYLNLSRGFIAYVNQDNNNKDKNYKEKHKTYMEGADKILHLSKDFLKQQDLDKTVDDIQKKNRLRMKNDSNGSNNYLLSKKPSEKNGISFSPNTKSKSKKNTIKDEKEKGQKEEKKIIKMDDDSFNYLKNRKVDYLSFVNKGKKSPNKKNLNKQRSSQNYFELEREMKLNQKKEARRGRSSDISINLKDHQNKKINKNNKLNRINNIEEEEEEEKNNNRFNNYSVPKRMNKIKKYHFKTKDERERELEIGALKYLNNMNNKSKSKNRYKYLYNSNDEIISKKKRNNKSLDQNNIRKNYKFYKNENMNERKKQNKNQYLNLRKNNKKNKYNPNNINSSFDAYNNNCDFYYNDSPNKNNNKRKSKNTFLNEYKRILEFNRKRQLESQDNKTLKNPSIDKTENNNYEKNDNYEQINTDYYIGKNGKYGYNRNTRSMPRKYIYNYQAGHVTEERKRYNNKYNPKKFNVVSTTNCTNTDTSKNTTIHFQGKNKNSNSKRLYSKGLK